MGRDVPLRPRPVGPLDRVDLEGQVAAAVEDAAIDDPLGELVVGRIRGQGSVAR